MELAGAILLGPTGAPQVDRQRLFERAKESGECLYQTPCGAEARSVSSRDELREPCGLSYRELGSLGDEAVMEHLVRGHGDAAAVLVDRYSRLVLSIATRILGDPVEAEDVAQQVFVDLCRTAARFDPAKGTTKMWIIRTVYRRSLTRRRDLRTRGAVLPARLDEVLNVCSGEEPAAPGRLSAYESRRLVRQILATLDASQRRVLELVYFDGLSLRDVARETGATLDSVRHRYYRGIAKMRKVLGEDRLVENPLQEESQRPREAIDAEA